MKKIDWIIILCTVVLSVFTLKDLFIPGFYTSHDGPNQVVRLYYFDQALRDGQIPPRWAGNLLNGFGYPLFIYSYHMPWFIAEPLVLAGLPIIDSIKMTFLIGFILSGIAMYFYGRDMFGRTAAVAAMALYLYAPYRFSNIFVRAAIGDATAFIFIPIIFWSLYKLRSHVTKTLNWKWIAIGALGYAGLLLSHAMVFILVTFAMAIYLLYWFILTKHKRVLVLSSALLVFLGVGMASYYFIPSFTERNLTRFNDIMGSALTGATFVPWSRLVYSPWAYGAMMNPEGAMSLQVGIAQWGTLILSCILMVWGVTRRKFRGVLRSIGLDAVCFLSIFILSIILMLPISLPFWRFFNSIMVIDFTWRILPVTVFCIAVLAGFAIRVVKWKYPVAIGLILLGLYANRNHVRINQSLDWSVPFFLSLVKTTNTYDEYTPKAVDMGLVAKKQPIVQSQIAGTKIDVQKSSSRELLFSVNTPAEGTISINKIYYPGWRATVDGTSTPMDTKNGFMALHVPRGVSQVHLSLHETALRMISNIITILSCGIVGVLLWKQKRHL